MSRYSLIFEKVTLPSPAGSWPASIDLHLGLREVLLIEGVSVEESQAFLSVAATTSYPSQGRVIHWDRDDLSLARAELYELRRLIAYIHPGQVLLHDLTVAENIGLGPAYHHGMTLSETLREHASLIEHLGLEPYLNLRPPEVPRGVYPHVVWARELVKRPELILAIVEETAEGARTHEKFFALLQDYLEKLGSPVILAGSSLTLFRPLAHRILSLVSGRILEQDFLEHRGRPLVAYLPLVS